MVLKKKGSLLDPLILIVIIFIVGFVAILGFKIFGSVNDNLQANDVLDSDQKEILQTAHDTYISVFDIGFLIIFIMFLIAIIVGAFLIDTHPIFLPIFLFLAIILIMITGILGNIYYDMTTQEFATERVQFPIIMFVMDNFIKMIVAVILISAVSLYAKSRL